MLRNLFNHRKQNTMRRKLFRYMLLFAGLLMIYVLVAMILFGQFKDVKESYRKNLDIQLSVLDKETVDYFEYATVYATHLSRVSSRILEDLMRERAITFEDLENNPELLRELQERLFERLKNSMLNANVSGAFVVWNTTMNSRVSDAENNRNGLYLQLNTKSAKAPSVLVYRGDAELGKRHEAMPHRKWRMEYQTSNIPNFSELMSKDRPPYRMTPVFTLPGTTQKVMLITVPIVGKDGASYGLCGFEVAQVHFKEKFSQATNLARLSCLFVPVAREEIDTGLSLSSGVQNGYYYVPDETLMVEDFGKGLTRFVGSESDYIGMIREVSLVPNAEKSQLVTMIPKDDYDRELFASGIEIAISAILFLFFAIVVSLMFSRRYIAPITESLSVIRDKKKILAGDYDLETNPSGLYEIDELVKFVREEMQERSSEELPEYLKQEFDRFIEATSDLTPAEMNVLSLLIQGYEVKELPDVLFISKSTVKHHISKIYKKLGVSSRGELLLYLEMLKGCGLIDQITSRHSNQPGDEADEDSSDTV